jgi:hypothetical protein
MYDPHLKIAFYGVYVTQNPQFFFLNKRPTSESHRVLVRQPEVKGPRGRYKRRWEDTIMMDLQEAGCGGMNGIELAHDRDRGGKL